MNDRPEDRELLSAWVGGDQRSGDQLCQRYKGIIGRFFRSKAPESAQDLAQATMEALVRSSARYSGEGSFRSFALGIARNVFRHHLRSCSRSRLSFNLEEWSCEALGLDPYERLLGDEGHRLLARGLRRIPVDHQIVIELHYWEGMNSFEIGAVLGVPASTIRDRRRRAEQLLRRELDSLGRADRSVETTLAGLQTWVDGIKRRV
ncbi:MAG: RNA polymerase sigma factor [Deltaproteobacteria bacterium]|nr:RNA polymerase sigma factor [Deltaproteobacteria bacterium]